MPMRPIWPPRTSAGFWPSPTPISFTRVMATRPASSGPRLAASAPPPPKSLISRLSLALLDVFSLREKVSSPDRVRGRLRSKTPWRPYRPERRINNAEGRPFGRPSRFTEPMVLNSLRRELDFGSGGADVGIDLGFELGEVLLEHPDQGARGLVEFGLVLPGVDRSENPPRS